MAVDVIFLSELVRELAGVLDGGKIEKVNQPSRSELILTVKAGGERRDLYIGGIGSGGRICLTEREYDRPSEPPMFCMLLRKHLVGARITSITQTEGERIVELSLDAPERYTDGRGRNNYGLPLPLRRGDGGQGDTPRNEIQVSRQSPPDTANVKAP